MPDGSQALMETPQLKNKLGGGVVFLRVENGNSHNWYLA